MTTFETRLTEAIAAILEAAPVSAAQPAQQTKPAQPTQPPLIERIKQALAAGRLRVQHLFDMGTYQLNLILKTTPAERQQLVNWGAWYQTQNNDWVLDTRKIPGLHQGASTKLDPLAAGALRKLLAAINAGKIFSGAIMYGGALTGIGLSTPEIKAAKDVGILTNAEGGWELDDNKLALLRRQVGA